MSERLIQMLLNQRWMILIVNIAMTLLSAATASRVSFDSSIECWFTDSSATAGP